METVAVWCHGDWCDYKDWIFEYPPPPLHLFDEINITKSTVTSDEHLRTTEQAYNNALLMSWNMGPMEYSTTFDYDDVPPPITATNTSGNTVYPLFDDADRRAGEVAATLLMDDVHKEEQCDSAFECNTKIKRSVIKMIMELKARCVESESECGEELFIYGSHDIPNRYLRWVSEPWLERSTVEVGEDDKEVWTNPHHKVWDGDDGWEFGDLSGGIFGSGPFNQHRDQKTGVQVANCYSNSDRRITEARVWEHINSLHPVYPEMEQ